MEWKSHTHTSGVSKNASNKSHLVFAVEKLYICFYDNFKVCPNMDSFAENKSVTTHYELLSKVIHCMNSTSYFGDFWLLVLYLTLKI